MLNDLFLFAGACHCVNVQPVQVRDLELAVVFDLTQNPFHLLNLSIRASREEVAEAYEEALANGQADENALVRAQQLLLTPRTRIEAELSWLPGLPPSQAREVLSKLETNNPDALALLEHLQGLDKANLAADLCVRSGGVETAYVNALLHAYEDIKHDVVHTTLTSLRRVSGFPIPNLQQVGSALSTLMVGHAKATVACVTGTNRPGDALTEIVETFLDWGDDNVEHLLALIVREYDAWSQPHLAKIKERIEADIASYRSGSDIVPAERFASLLADWDTISQPVQLLEESKGHEEPRSKEVYAILRDFCVWLANENGQYDKALSISRALLDTFPELPAVAAQLLQDVNTLESLAEEANSVELMGPLVDAVENAKAQMSSFDEDLVTSGFGPNSRGLAKQLYHAFVDVTARATGTELADMPWMVVRGLAIDLNNEHESPEGACAILAQLISHTDTTTPSNAVVEKLEDDLRTLRRNLKWDELNRMSGDESRRLSLISDLLEGATAEEQTLLFQLKTALERRKAFTTVKRIFFGLAVTIILGFIMKELLSEPSRRSGSSTTTASTSSTSQHSYSPNSSASSQLSEKIPAPGTGRLLNKREVRYCIFQGERLHILRTLVSSSSDREIDHFNAIIQDFNSRCSNFQYREGVLQTIEAEVPGNRSRLRLDAQRMLLSWSELNSSLSGERLADITTQSGARLVQMRLTELGYYSGAIDGIWGQASRTALRSFKYSQPELDYNDIWDLATQRALMSR